MVTSKIDSRIASAILLIAAVLYIPSVSIAAQSAKGNAVEPQPPPQAEEMSKYLALGLDFQFFKARVEPIFLKKRGDLARCYSCHQKGKHGGMHFFLEPLNPGSSFWTEQQSRFNFQNALRLINPTDRDASPFLMYPLAPEAGGKRWPLHDGGRNFLSQSDPDYQTMREWVHGQTAASGSSEP